MRKICIRQSLFPMSINDAKSSKTVAWKEFLANGVG